MKKAWPAVSIVRSTTVEAPAAPEAVVAAPETPAEIETSAVPEAAADETVEAPSEPEAPQKEAPSAPDADQQ